MTKLDRTLVVFIAACLIFCGLLVYSISVIAEQIPHAEEPETVEILPEPKAVDPMEIPAISEIEKEQETWTEDDVYCLACVAYQEAGSEHYSNLTRRYVIDVVLNRVEDDRFPDTIRGVLEDAPNGAMQYGLFSVTGVQRLIRWTTEEERRQEDEMFMLCWIDAENALRGDHTELYGAGYIWQSENPQGTDQIWMNGICFAR